MSKKPFFVGGNWKMNGNKKSIDDLIKMLNEATVNPNTGNLSHPYSQTRLLVPRIIECASSQYVNPPHPEPRRPLTVRSPRKPGLMSRYGAVHKVLHARAGRGVRVGVTVCDRGRGSRACDVTLVLFLSYILNMKFKVMFNFLL